MRVRVAYVEEPPFYWTEGGAATGSDIELAEAVLRSLGADRIEFVPTTFDELLPGVRAGRWEMNVPIFITPAREREVAFSRPVWTLVDGLIVRHGNPLHLSAYADVAALDARLGVIPGQVQITAASSAGVRGGQLVEFGDQGSAITALLAGEIDAFAATAVGNRAAVDQHPDLDQVVLAPADGGALTGGFSFALDSPLQSVVNAELARYLGSRWHRDTVGRFGITAAEIDPVI
jgi:polar amino acid transport system substrate-binding protein